MNNGSAVCRTLQLVICPIYYLLSIGMGYFFISFAYIFLLVPHKCYKMAFCGEFIIESRGSIRSIYPSLSMISFLVGHIYDDWDEISADTPFQRFINAPRKLDLKVNVGQLFLCKPTRDCDSPTKSKIYWACGAFYLKPYEYDRLVILLCSDMRIV